MTVVIVVVVAAAAVVATAVAIALVNAILPIPEAPRCVPRNFAY